MKEIAGDFLKIYRDYDVVCCTTNTCTNNKNELVMGRGIAYLFKHEWPELPKIWGEKILKTKPRELPLVFVESVLTGSGLCGTGNKVKYLVAFPTKKDWRQDSILEVIHNSAKQLDYLADVFGWKSVLLPKPGCCNGGLSWENVKLVISFLDERFWILSKE